MKNNSQILIETVKTLWIKETAKTRENLIKLIDAECKKLNLNPSNFYMVFGV